METAIRLENVVKKYPKFTLDQINLELPKGCIMGLVGENGAGKTTLIKCILGLISLSDGRIYKDEKVISEKEIEWKNDVGVVMSGSSYPGNLNAKQINKIMENIYSRWDKNIFFDYLKQFHIDENKYTKDYSTGMAMKLQIAVAFSHNAKLLLLDEATSGLDPVVRDEILEILQNFIQDEECTVLFSSHITSDLEKVADYITFLHKGKLIFSENKDELLYNYGVVRCSKEDYKRISPEHVIGLRKNQFGYEVMVDNRIDISRQNRDWVVDTTTLEEIILFQIKGDVL